MATPVDFTFFDRIGAQVREYFFQQVWSWGMAAQIASIAGALLLARQASGAMRAWLTRQQAQYAQDPKKLAPTWPRSWISSR